MTERECCCGGSCGDLSRRDFVRIAGAAGAMAALPVPVMAGPFQNDGSDYRNVIPADKKLNPAWVRSLFERGTKEIYSNPEDLDRIGMPVGGFFAGTVYLGGDGRLWLWDIFNRDQEGIEPRRVDYKGGKVRMRNGANYVEPCPPTSPFPVGFSLKVEGKTYTLNREGFSRVSFDGRYPIGRVTYRTDGCPIEVALEGFSPFLPLNLEDSSLPAVVMSFTVRNRSDKPLKVELCGHLGNPVLRQTGGVATRANRVIREKMLTMLACSAEMGEDANFPRPDLPFDSFEKETYEGWTVEGEAFGKGPVRARDLPDYQGKVGNEGKRLVNSHASAGPGSTEERDARTGTLTSREFTIERKRISFLIGGGPHKGKTCIELLMDGKVAASATGKGSNMMRRASFDVSAHEGKKARLRIADRAKGEWGNLGVDDILFTDAPSTDAQEARDFGSMALACLSGEARATAKRGEETQRAGEAGDDALIGEVTHSLALEPGKSGTADFAVTWHFPNFRSRPFRNRRVGHHYAVRFESAPAAARYLAAHFDRLAGGTRRWTETWYDSTLPYWLLDRTMANTSILATTTCYRFENGRFWAWEGIGCCNGTCTHVWQYAQAPGRLFPEVERITRERIDFGKGLHSNGSIAHRVDDATHKVAVDGHCGRILGAYREHQMSGNDAFLRRIWPNVRKAVEYLLRIDGNGDGILEGAQANTLDAAWYGKISWISSLHLAALRAGAAMAKEMGDAGFASRCRGVAEKGASSILELYNGEYFIQIEDPKHLKAIGTGQGCHIDQVFGQSWAHWVDLGRIFDREKCLNALRSLWKYNFAPFIGKFRDVFPAGRWYAMEGDAGLIMCTWPKGGKREGWKKHWQFGYFNECMSGYEWQAASHMVWESVHDPNLLKYGLAVSRAIHDRYNAKLRNPYNEIECSDHYSRAMASYGVFQAACGYQVHGPKGEMEFEPRLTPERFQAAFVAPEGWGLYRQNREGKTFSAALEVRHGSVSLRKLALVPGKDVSEARVNGKPAKFSRDGKRVSVTLSGEKIAAGQTLKVELS